MYDVIVIGAGAAGLMAAGTAAGAGNKVLLLEKMEKTGRKVRITGKGRCNLTNMRPREEFLEMVRPDPEFFAPAFDAFDNRRTVDFFTKLGVALSLERGERVFPSSGRAWDVADSLTDWCRRSGVNIELEARVTRILTRSGEVCGVECIEHGEADRFAKRQPKSRKNTPSPKPETLRIECRHVILCTGGLAYPATGSTGDGYSFAHELGHRIEPVRPSLVALESEMHQIRTLRGLALKNIIAKLMVNNRETASEFGEMEFTDRGIAGPVILRLSRDAVDALIEEQKVELSFDLKPALQPGKLADRIERERYNLTSPARLEELIRKLVPRSLIPHLCRKLELQPRQLLSTIAPAKYAELACVLKDFRIPVCDYRPFEEAIVTAGGVSLEEVDPCSLQSRIVKGLYFAGEILDLDANTGGYNLQIAFSTGYLAGCLNEIQKP